MIRVYKHGIHKGEEKIVQGNDLSGMVYISGCHLACSFCYTPETSKENLGNDYTQADFLVLLKSLIDQGAKNINLITATHIWGSLRPVLETFKQSYPKTPIVLKTSGFQSKAIVEQMASVADIIVMDYKVGDQRSALLNNLPKDYNKVAKKQVEFLERIKPHQYGSDGKLIKGVLIRHLVMPDYIDSTYYVLKEIQQTKFSGILNIMTIFLDPNTNKIKKLDTQTTSQLIQYINTNNISVLVNGKAPKVIA